MKHQDFLNDGFGQAGQRNGVLAPVLTAGAPGSNVQEVSTNLTGASKGKALQTPRSLFDSLGVSIAALRELEKKLPEKKTKVVPKVELPQRPRPQKQTRTFERAQEFFD